MAYTFDQLRVKTLAELRDIARDTAHEAVTGWSQMNKDHLLPALCKAFGIDAHVHHAVVGLDKSQLKARLRALKAARDEAIAAGDREKLAAVRREHDAQLARVGGHLTRREHHGHVAWERLAEIQQPIAVRAHSLLRQGGR